MDQSVQRIKAARWREIVQECNRATAGEGISKADWCKQNGIAPKSLFGIFNAFILPYINYLL